MNYPQGYIFLKLTTQLPPLPMIQAWFGSSNAIYVRGVSEPSKVLDERISLLEQLHRYAIEKSDYRMQSIVFCGTAVSELFLMIQMDDLIKVYWVDSEDQAKEIEELSRYIDCARQLDIHILNVRETYSSMSKYIYSKTGQRLTGDADIERFFSGRDWGTRTEAEIHIRQIAKNETRAGVLWRIDLQNQLETGP